MPAGNLLSDVGFPPCACIIGEERGSSAGRSPPRLCRGLACGVFLSPTGFIYSHARQGGFSHSAAGSGLRGVLAGWLVRCLLPAQPPRGAPGKLRPTHLGCLPASAALPGGGGPQKLPCLGGQQPWLPLPPAPSVIPALSERESHFCVYLPRSGAQEPPPTSQPGSQLGEHRNCPAR